LKQRLLREGADGLTEAEILELLFTFSIPGGDVARQARELVERFGDLKGVLSASSSELTRVEGLGDHTATLVRLAGEIAARCSGPIYPPTEILRHPKEMERYLVSRMGGMKEENVLLVFLNDQGQLLGEEMLGGGTVNQVVVFPRQVMQKALQHNASELLIVHNHPHGPPLPTLRDREEAERLSEAMRPFDVTVKDSIVVGAGRCFSIFKNSPL
jgi:DNA repair protein RadC